MKQASESRCPTCGGVEVVFSFELPEATVRRCRGCRHSFSTEVKVPAQEIYSPQYFQETHRRYFENPDLELFSWIAGRIGERFPPEAGIVDIGCGMGHLLRYLKSQKGFSNLTGVDLVPGAADGGYRHLQGDFLTMPLSGPFDVAVSIMNIEHIAEPVPYMRRVHALLPKHGIFVVSTVNERSLVYGMARLLQRCGVPFAARRLYDPHHVVHYSDIGLRRLAEASGFEVEEIRLRDRPLAAVDFPPGVAMSAVKAAVAGLTLFGNAIGSSYTQTQLLRKV